MSDAAINAFRLSRDNALDNALVDAMQRRSRLPADKVVSKTSVKPAKAGQLPKSPLELRAQTPAFLRPDAAGDLQSLRAAELRADARAGQA